MGKKLVIISTTLRKEGNSAILASEFARGAKEMGNIVKYISLEDKEIKFCKGCLACQKLKRGCIIKDDMSKILEELKSSDVIVFATPIYYYEMSGQMKTFLDRTNPLFDTDYKFKDIYLLATAADTEDRAIDGAINGLNGWIECFDRTSLKGVIRGVSVTEVGEIKNFSDKLKLAYKMGKNI